MPGARSTGLWYPLAVGSRPLDRDGGTASTASPDDTERAIPAIAADERASLIARRRALPIGSLLGGDRFRLLRRIGEGGMGVVCPPRCVRPQHAQPRLRQRPHQLRRRSCIAPASDDSRL
jgi:hypothetical protein